MVSADASGLLGVHEDVKALIEVALPAMLLSAPVGKGDDLAAVLCPARRANADWFVHLRLQQMTKLPIAM
jgi:hypothetical protein